MSTSEEPIDPFEAHFHRDPLPGAAVRVIVLSRGDVHRADEAASGLVALIGARGRTAESVVVSLAGRRLNQALDEGLRGATTPLVLVTSSEDPWSAAHLDPLFESIDLCDHVVGRRRIGVYGRLKRWFGRFPWRILFAVPVFDVHSPCRMHRLEKLNAIPLQSSSEFLDVEILAKATFFGHLIDEVRVPPLRSPELWAFWHDFVEVFRNPILARPSSPPKDTQGEVEGDERPGREDGERGGDVEEAGPLEDDSA